MKFLRYKIIAYILLFAFASNYEAKAQQFKRNTEIGLLVGASYYIGDLNTVHFNEALPAGAIAVRYNLNKRFAYKAAAMYTNLKSDERNSDDINAANRGLHFRSHLYEISGQVEFNFLPYQPGNPLYTWTPFVYTGISLFHFSPQAENANGEWVDLQELGTEGQFTADGDGEKYGLTQVSVPLGLGFKIAVSNSFNIILEYGTRKTFSDYLDDVSTTFIGDQITAGASQETIEMSDPIGVLDPTRAHSKGDQRGDPGKQDWYSFAGVTLSFKLNTNTKGCDYQ